MVVTNQLQIDGRKAFEEKLLDLKKVWNMTAGSV